MTSSKLKMSLKINRVSVCALFAVYRVNGAYNGGYRAEQIAVGTRCFVGDKCVMVSGDAGLGEGAHSGRKCLCLGWLRRPCPNLFRASKRVVVSRGRSGVLKALS